VSFGFRVTDENSRPVIYNEGVKALLFDFIQRKTNLQYRQLKEKNQNAFVWLSSVAPEALPDEKLQELLHLLSS